MSRLKYLKNIRLSELSAERLTHALKVRLQDIPHRLAWRLNGPLAEENKKKLSKIRDIHKGQRCFIVANGPSLKKTNLSLLKNEFTFGMNRIYLSRESLDFYPTYLVVHDVRVQLCQFTSDYEEISTKKFFNWNARKLFSNKENLCFIRSDFSPHFSSDLTKTTWAGHSVTNICIQIAFFMGFDEVILVGKDHSFSEIGVPGQVIKSEGKEDNHFTKGYYKKGMIWKIPDYKGEELAYKMARKAYEENGRKIYDATIDGKLDVFEKVDYYSLFER